MTDPALDRSWDRIRDELRSAVTDAVWRLWLEALTPRELVGDTLVVEVGDDGVGGADPARGSGLTGLTDRVDAAGGALTITSPTGQGTTVRAALPAG